MKKLIGLLRIIWQELTRKRDWFDLYEEENGL